MNPTTFGFTSGEWKCIKWTDLRKGDRVKILMQNGDQHLLTIATQPERGESTESGVLTDRHGTTYYTSTITSILLDPDCRPNLPQDMGRMIHSVKVNSGFEFEYGIRTGTPEMEYHWRLFNADSRYASRYADWQIVEFTPNG